MDGSLDKSPPRKGIIRLTQGHTLPEGTISAWAPTFVPQQHHSQPTSEGRPASQRAEGSVASQGMLREWSTPYAGSEDYGDVPKGKPAVLPASATRVHASSGMNADPGDEKHANRRQGHHDDRRHNRGGRHGGSGRDRDGGARGTGRSDAEGRSASGRLFDPRRDDPVRFAALRKGSGIAGSTEGATGSASLTSLSDARSVLSSNAPSVTTQSTVSSDGRDRRRRRGPGSRTTMESGETGSGKHKRAADPASDHNSYVIELKRRYRDLSLLERKLQAEHKTSSEQQRKMQAEMPTQAIVGPNEAKSFSITRMLTEGHGISKTGFLDHGYWIDLIAQHRALAEAHVAFMEAALRPGLPASLQSLSQTYNIPTRLWHTGFHSLLERLRTLLPSWQTLIGMRESGVSAETKMQIGEALDLMTDFIYFAYAYYSNLLESELFKVFRSSWIENLGDIARYRMAVAKINYLVGLSDGVKDEAQRRDSGSGHSLGLPKKARAGAETDTAADPGEDPGDSSDEEAEQTSDQLKQDRASIGVAAARDWDLEEKEIWRMTARGWYAKGLSEVPGTGRLHHHLGILSRDDDLRALYHFCKSLTASHPYPAARESVLPLFERSAQTRRLSDDASLIDLFVFMHGTLFTRVQIDDFEPTLDRFTERLRSESRDERHGLAASTWMMMATINVAAILAYGTCTGREVTSAGAGGSSSNEKEETGGEGEDAEADDDEDEEVASTGPMETQEGSENSASEEVLAVTTDKALKLTFGVMDAVIGSFLDRAGRDTAANPYITVLMTFIGQECKLDGMLPRFEAYIPWTRLVAMGNAVPRHAEPIDPRRDVPHKIRSNDIPLPEDWCLRGMAWVGRRVYERGFWKPQRSGRQVLRGGLAVFDSEMDMLERYARTATDGSDGMYSEEAGDDDEEEEADDGQFHVHAQTHAEGANTLTLSELRWKRIVHVLTVLIKTVPGLDFDIGSGNVHARHGALVIAPPLENKLVAWQAVATRREVEQAIGHVSLAELEGVSVKKGDRGGLVSDEEEEEEDAYMATLMPSDAATSNETKDLMRKRMDLHQQLRQARVMDLPRSIAKASSATRHRGGKFRDGSMKAAQERVSIRMIPGYTTLILDTNVFLTPTDIFTQLSESEGWMIVVPLSVVTELDGLKRRSDEVGRRAEKALKDLEGRMKTKHVRVQTSRGNYLSDLKVRQEDIHFASIVSGAYYPATYGRDGQTTSKANVAGTADVVERAGKEHGGGDGGDDEGQARSVDDVILRCLHWQATTHWRNRLLLFCSDEVEYARREAQIADTTDKPAVARAALITLDRNLRIKARFRQLQALGPQELVELLLHAAASSELDQQG